MSHALPDDPEMLKAMPLAERCERERLRQIIQEMQRHRFGRKAETLPEEQMLLGPEDVEQVAAAGEAKQDEDAPQGRAARTRKRRSNRGALPAHLPRIEIVVDLEDKTCSCCQGELHRIGEDKSERLDLVPAQFGSWSPGAPNTPADPARTAASRPRFLPGRSMADCRPRPPSPRFWCPNMPTTCRYTGKPRSTPARAMSWIVRR